MPSESVIVGSVYPLEFYGGRFKNQASITFSAPYANGIMAISPEQLTLPVTPPYYGDVINLQFWKLLGAPFGKVPDPENPLTKQSGYMYVYNFSRKTFTVYNEYSERIIFKENIKSLAELNIDFTIMNSHQFLVLVDPSDLGGHRFIFDPTLKEREYKGFSEELKTVGNIKTVIFSKPFVKNTRVYNLEIENKTPTLDNTRDSLLYIPYLLGVNNADVADRKRPYDKDDADHFQWHHPLYIKGIEDYIVSKYKNYIYSAHGYDMDKLTTVFKTDIRWDKTLPTNYFYWETDMVYEMLKLTDVFESDIPEYDVLLPKLSNDLFPNRQMIQRVNETQNNRPVYEPWLIYHLEWESWLEFDIIKYPPGTTVDKKDTYEVEVWDMSPWWA